jgi:hypothetical protein
MHFGLISAARTSLLMILLCKLGMPRNWLRPPPDTFFRNEQADIRLAPTSPQLWHMHFQRLVSRSHPQLGSALLIQILEELSSSACFNWPAP